MPLDHPYISFNKLVGVNSLNEYDDLYGEHIYYGWGFTWEEREDGLVEIKFLTRWEYPICAITKAIEIAHDTEWYAVEENYIYVSHFYWDDGVKEDVLYIEDEYSDWRHKYPEFSDVIELPDEIAWYYLNTAKGRWQRQECDDLVAKYKGKPAYKITPNFN